MKKLLLILFLSSTIISSANADGADDWQNVGFNTGVLDLLNQCQGCVLRSTNYSGANLAGANLTGANFIQANLAGTNFYGANLEGASLFLSLIHI